MPGARSAGQVDRARPPLLRRDRRALRGTDRRVCDARREGVIVARPTKLTPEVTERIVQAVKAGNYVHVAAQAAGISPSTFYRWMERGERESDGIYAEFYTAVRRAEGEAEVQAV